MLAKENDSFIHRQIDEKGNELERRVLNLEQKKIDQILKISFHYKSYLLHEKSGKISVIIIEKDGTSSSKELYNITDPFYNSWQPVEVGPNTFITRFNGEFGNGWFTIKEDQLIEFFYSKGQMGYKNLLTNDVLEMEHEKLVISGINKTKNNSYSVIFYPQTIEKTKNKNLIILNREIK
ncbi:hypothetical protein [Pedobacter sp. NJ-S-72]